MLALEKKVLIRTLRFAVVGFSGLLIDFLITWYFKEIKGCSYLLSNALGFVLASLNNYMLNKLFTFKDKDPRIIRQFMIFLSVSMLGLLINTIIVYYFNGQFKVNFYLSKFLAIVIVFLWNFAVNQRITFGNKPV